MPLISEYYFFCPILLNLFIGSSHFLCVESLEFIYIVYMDFLGMLLKGRFHLSKSGWDLRVCISNASPLPLPLPEHAAGASRGAVLVHTVKVESLFYSESNLKEGKSRVVEARFMTWRWHISLLRIYFGWNLSYVPRVLQGHLGNVILLQVWECFGMAGVTSYCSGEEGKAKCWWRRPFSLLLPSRKNYGLVWGGLLMAKKL